MAQAAVCLSTKHGDQVQTPVPMCDLKYFGDLKT